jgi:hypothetical protein
MMARQRMQPRQQSLTFSDGVDLNAILSQTEIDPILLSTVTVYVVP